MITEYNFKYMILFFTLFFVTCKKESDNFLPTNDIKNGQLYFQDSCTQKEVMNNLFKKIIDLPQLQQYIAIQEEPWLNQESLVIENFSGYTDSLDLKKINKKVVIKSKSEIENEKIKAYLSIDSLVISKSNVKIKFYYPIQGLGVRAEFIDSSNCDWKLNKIHLWEN